MLSQSILSALKRFYEQEKHNFSVHFRLGIMVYYFFF